MLTVTAPASDPSLLTVAELRAAAGIADGSRDADLATLGARVAASIAQICRVAAAGATPPTLRKETLTETLRLDAALPRRPHIVLSRRPVVSVASVTEAGTAVAAADYEVQAAAGMLLRLSGDSPSTWASGKIVAVYDAGWDTVPDDLKLAASKLAQALWVESSRDPSLKSVTVDGVGSREYWIGPSGDPLIPAEVMDLLAPYMNPSV